MFLVFAPTSLTKFRFWGGVDHKELIVPDHTELGLRDSKLTMSPKKTLPDNTSMPTKESLLDKESLLSKESLLK